MDNQADIIEPQELSIGQRLRQAREKVGLDLIAVAEKIHLKVAILNHLEQDRFSLPNLPPAFMKGYLKNYAKFLNIVISSEEFAQLQFGDNVYKKPRIRTVINDDVAHSRWAAHLTWLVVFFLISMTVLWWWQDHQRSQTERQDFVESHLSPKTTSNVIPTNLTKNEKVESDVTDNTAIKSYSSADSIKRDSQQPVSDERIEGIPSPQITTPALTLVATSSNATTSSKIELPNTSTEALEKAMQRIDHSKQVMKQEKKGEKGIVPLSEGLQLDVIANSCWITIKDGNNDILAQKIYFAGDKLHFNTKPPYDLVIGAPSNVKISYLGKEIPIKLDGKVARLRLPQKG
ncbi:hypothetical protein CEP49_06340 [Mergibacter septicus]|uniref:RodZ domain-containing protein n=1 Tax=Mergibacter septicus TaxID=221402 RepID=UPI0011792A2A|nr:RodZ domain-containing protein [Mergibacter septicus]AWX14195.1 hypothetical protein CEP49_06340 [Mergibacter septicus]